MNKYLGRNCGPKRIYISFVLELRKGFVFGKQWGFQNIKHIVLYIYLLVFMLLRSQNIQTLLLQCVTCFLSIQITKHLTITIVLLLCTLPETQNIIIAMLFLLLFSQNTKNIILSIFFIFFTVFGKDATGEWLMKGNGVQALQKLQKNMKHIDQILFVVF